MPCANSRSARTCRPCSAARCSFATDLSYPGGLLSLYFRLSGESPFAPARGPLFLLRTFEACGLESPCMLGEASV